MTKQEPLVFGRYYHIYNQGNNQETIFRSDDNYRFFLQQYAKYIEPVAATFAYCLLPNHFHFVIYIRREQEQESYHQRFHLSERWNLLDPTKQFRRFFTSYAMAFNRQRQRKGSLFRKNFRRKSVNHENYFTNLITYIHQNPQKHGIVDDFRDWPWSSYGTLLSDRGTRLQRKAVLKWFQNRKNFVESHQTIIEEASIELLLAEDWYD